MIYERLRCERDQASEKKFESRNLLCVGADSFLTWPVHFFFPVRLFLKPSPLHSHRSRRTHELGKGRERQITRPVTSAVVTTHTGLCECFSPICSSPSSSEVTALRLIEQGTRERGTEATTPKKKKNTHARGGIFGTQCAVNKIRCRGF